MYKPDPDSHTKSARVNVKIERRTSKVIMFVSFQDQCGIVGVADNGPNRRT